MGEKKFIIITGAASGIGLNLAQTLEEQGERLVLVDFNKEALFGNFKPSDRVKLVVGDVSQKEVWQQVIEISQNESSSITHLINSAGVIRPGFVTDFEISDIDFHLNVNTKGSILGTTLIGRLMKKQGFGHIINISSLAGLAPVSGLSLYTASKFAIRGFSLAVAAELKKFGVHVSVVCPDLVNTPMLDLQLDYPEEAVLTFSGPKKVLQPEDLTQSILNLMKKPRLLVCIPENRGLLAKIAGAWPSLAEVFRKGLEKKGKETIKRLK
ncbi:SDR family oxidoreductase [Algoriphagus kandeliae]|uniref:SDR family oxidoreductase n=1 Tax=Algoriphagus kandeliae TaxID=2562278 RepID=A0A4Y9QV74_9BACT|nr:SDR family oxidoreductase [Algoriphagus kandeliae]TFV96117.1 SDR family oxidoreductase [Algoriphagus kandeliae]